MTIERSVSAPTWRDPSAAPAERVSDLLARLSIAEKVAQLQGAWAGVDAAGDVAPHHDGFAVAPGSWDELIRDGIGQLTRVYGTAPVAPAEGARAVARSQRQVMAAGRHGIPAMVHEECLTGLAAWQATVYPSPLCWGATFDPALIERMGAQIGATMRRLGVHQGLAPVLDVLRDLRWGRVEETIGEDPYLVGVGRQRRTCAGLESAGVVATLKHFAGYSASRGGRNLAPVSIGPRELADVLLPPFEMALRAGARSVMNSYTDLDGVPAAADPRPADQPAPGGLRVHRDGGLRLLLGGVPADPARGGREPRPRRPGWRCDAGIDVELPAADCYGGPLLAALADGTIDIAVVDRAVRRVLTQKCELGLLDPDWSPDPELGRGRHRHPRRHASPARWPGRSPAARSSCSPTPAPCRWRPGQRIAVVGPRAARGQRDARLLLVPAARRRAPPRSAARDRGADRAGRAARRSGRVRGQLRGRLPGARRRRRRPGRGGRRGGRGARSASRCSATWPACSGGAPPARAATRPTCGCPAARRSCSRRCWLPARRWCWCSWPGGRTTCPARLTGWPPRCAASSPARRARPRWPTC